MSQIKLTEEQKVQIAKERAEKAEAFSKMINFESGRAFVMGIVDKDGIVSLFTGGEDADISLISSLANHRALDSITQQMKRAGQ